MGQIETPPGGEVCFVPVSCMKARHKQSALDRLETVRGQLDAVIAMLEDERHCPQVMKQLYA